MELKATQLRHFVNVADSKSFKEAARRSFRSQPAVSLAVKTLESHIGAPLFENSKRVVLTSFGARILPIAQEFLEHHDRLSRALDQVATGAVGDLWIAANPSVASRWLPEVIREYTKLFPGVSVYATDDNSEKVLDLVISGRVEIGIASVGRETAEVEVTPILSDGFGLVCRNDHELNRRTGPLKWSHLDGHAIIGNMTLRLLTGTPAYPYVSQPRMFMSTLTSLLANVEAGVGVTVLPQMAAPDNHPRLAFRRLHGPRLKRTIGMVVRRGRTLSPQATAMREVILRRFERHAKKPESR